MAFPRPGAFRVRPERNLRDTDANGVSTRVGISQTEDRQPALACPLLQGRLIAGVTLNTVASTTPIMHRLGRKPVGYLITLAPTVPWVPPIFVSSDDKFLILQSQVVAQLTLDLYVF